MAATSVRVEAEVKAELDRLQGVLQGETGERLSHSEVLARLIRFARRHEMGFLAADPDDWQPPRPADLERHLAKVKGLRAPRIDVTRIDEELYGGDAR